ncbi:MAG: hypothetical protein ACLVK4_12200 [Alistipes shahii]
MNRTVYFADKAVLFTAETPGGAWYAVSSGRWGRFITGQDTEFSRIAQ